MNNIRAVAFNEVLSAFDKEHPMAQGSNEWARTRLVEANQKFKGEWRKVSLSRRDLNNILLVWHHDPKEGLELIPEHGATLAEVAARWKNIRHTYQSTNTECFKKILAFGESPFSTVFLSAAPLKGFNVPEYEKLQYREGCLVHLDGLHRLIGWAIAVRFNWFRYFFSKDKVEAFVAGSLVS
jgi:uncharacterized protein DUF6309